MTSLPFPFAVIDFEASSLDMASYPIEVGLAIARNSDQPLELWSTLIRPPKRWTEMGWDPEAEAVHGISRQQLMDGIEPSVALQRLNERLYGVNSVYCDDPRYDPHWLKTLVTESAPILAAFQMMPISMLFAFNRRAYNRYADALATSSIPHRAEADAARFCSSLILAFDKGVGS